MEHYEDRFDFHGLGLAIKDAREKRGWTQEYLAELVGRTSHTIMNIENKGQYPSFGVFVKLVSMFDISVDQFIHSDSGNKESQRNGGFRVGASVLRRLSQVPLNGKQGNCGHTVAIFTFRPSGQNAKICLLGSLPKPGFGPTWPEMSASRCSLY